MAEHLLEEHYLKIVEIDFRLNIKGNMIRADLVKVSAKLKPISHRTSFHINQSIINSLKIVNN
jgi:hypothetical protein